MRRTHVILASLAVLLVLPTPASAWWDFIEQFSGPRGFWGPDIQLRLFCVVETPKEAGSPDTKIETRSAVPIGVILSLCKVDPATDKQRLMFDLGARFLRSKHYKGDTNPRFANGETIHFTTLEPAVMFPLAGKQDGLRLDYGFGAGVYWFSSEGFQSFKGAFLEPVRLDLRIPISKTWFRAVIARAGLLYFPAGFDPQAWGGSSDRIGAELVPVYSVFAEITPTTLAIAKKFGIR